MKFAVGMVCLHENVLRCSGRRSAKRGSRCPTSTFTCPFSPLDVRGEGDGDEGHTENMVLAAGMMGHAASTIFWE